MDERTLDYYERHARVLAETYDRARGGVARYFDQAFPPGCSVVDVGAGSGRDASLLASKGHRVHAVEPSAAMRAAATTRHGELRERILPGAVPDTLPTLAALNGPADAVLCAAVLQHVPRHALFDAVFALRGLVRAGGRALVSIPEGGRALDGESRDADGRLFTALASGELRLLFERCGFRTLSVWRDADGMGRPGIEWVTLLFELEAASGARPLDLVAGVLSRRERKVATYKLALLRALCEIALTQPRLARWTGERVALPLDAIATRWVRYYWPLFESDVFLPQMSGERAGQPHRLAFSRQLASLVGAFARLGGLPAYVVAERNDRLEPELEGARLTLLRSLKATIVKGPVTYAGGSLEQGRLFSHGAGELWLDGDLWRELVLTGHWIQDAVILRWADLTARLGQADGVTVADAVGRLTLDTEPLRDTRDARDVYDDAHDLRCVWTGAPRPARGFHIDHVLPFSLWRSNDLWNLVPALPSVNLDKSDRLPRHDFLVSRRAAMTACWEVARERRPRRFAREVSAFTGVRDPSMVVLFGAVLEAVEATALQRGAERWATG